MTCCQPTFLIERPAAIVVAIGVEPEHPARISRAKPQGVFSRQQCFPISAEASHLRGTLTVHRADEANAIGGQFGVELPKFVHAAHEVRRMHRDHAVVLGQRLSGSRGQHALKRGQVSLECADQRCQVRRGPSARHAL